MLTLTYQNGTRLTHLGGPTGTTDTGFDRLRREFTDRRRLLIETAAEAAPSLEGADLVRSEAGRHEYVFDAGRVPIASLLKQAAAQTEVRDVETHRPDIDDVLADLYERWQK